MDEVIREILSYKGNIDYETIGVILKKLSRLLDVFNWNLTTKKRVYSLMVEILENVHKHKDEIEDKNIANNYQTFFKLYESEQYVHLKAGNVVSAFNINKLKKHIDQVNKLSEEQLKDLYKKTITNGLISERGGAGLGIINIVKVSKNKIDYSIENINNNYCFIHIHVNVKVEKAINELNDFN